LRADILLPFYSKAFFFEVMQATLSKLFHMMRCDWCS